MLHCHLHELHERFCFRFKPGVSTNYAICLSDQLPKGTCVGPMHLYHTKEPVSIELCLLPGLYITIPVLGFIYFVVTTALYNSGEKELKHARVYLQLCLLSSRSAR